MNTARLGRVVAALLLWHVGCVSAHAGRDYGYAVALIPKDAACGTDAVVSAVKVDGPDVIPVLDAVVETTGLGGYACVGNHDVEAAEVLDDLANGSFDPGVVAHINLVRLDFDSKVFGDLR